MSELEYVALCRTLSRSIRKSPVVAPPKHHQHGSISDPETYPRLISQAIRGRKGMSRRVDIDDRSMLGIEEAYTESLQSQGNEEAPTVEPANDFRRVWKAYARQLPPQSRDVIDMVLAGKTQAHIGEVLGIGQSAVHHRLKSAMERIRILHTRPQCSSPVERVARLYGPYAGHVVRYLLDTHSQSEVARRMRTHGWYTATQTKVRYLLYRMEWALRCDEQTDIAELVVWLQEHLYMKPHEHCFRPGVNKYKRRSHG